MSYSTTFLTADGEAGKEIGKLFPTRSRSSALETTDPANYVFVAFQLTFAVITAALISGAVADRLKFSAWLVFLPVWVTLSYFPLAHMVWGGGFLSGVEDGLADLLFSGDGASRDRPDRLRRRHRRPHQRRCGGPGPGDPPRPAARLRQGADEAAQPDAHDDRRRSAVVRLVRVQRRLDRQPRRLRDRDRPGLAQHHVGDLRRDDGLAPDREDPRRQGHLARCRVRCRRRSGRDHAGLRQPGAVERDRARRSWPVASARSRSVSSTGSGTTTRSTSSASTWSAASSAPSASASSRRTTSAC